ncbi:hypothetical protein VNO77_21413 [Canavalia gladiata]|uniref:F-box domain-containing protein n=1 Tax=Canavalia gladiata TaxID=3824 RepID=A0AAN9LW42_CANGL
MENGKKKKLSVTFVFKLPEELIVEILLRLPVRSLLRFKCVCKSWLSLISDPQFAISHFDLNAAPSYRLLLRSTTPSIESHRRIDIDIDASIFMTLLPPRSTTRSIKSLDVEASLRHGSAVVNLLLPPPPSSNGDSHEDVEILGSCRGLVLLLYRSGDLVLWNPSTGVHKRISHSPYGLFFPFLPGGGFYGFGYDAPTDDYFVIFMVLNTVYRTQVEVFSLRTNSWDRVKCQRVNFQYEFLGHVFMAGSPLNGALHWLVYSPDNMEHVIIGFDLIERTLFEIPLPDDISLEPKYWLCPPRLRVMGGCLALCYPRAGKRDGIEIWVMKEYKMTKDSCLRILDMHIIE